MLKFTRTKYVTVDRPAKDKVVAHGILEDYIYAMELDVEFSFPDCEITAITGKMRRYTTPECSRHAHRAWIDGSCKKGNRARRLPALCHVIAGVLPCGDLRMDRLREKGS